MGCGECDFRSSIRDHERRIAELERQVAGLLAALWAAAGITSDDLARARERGH